MPKRDGVWVPSRRRTPESPRPKAVEFASSFEYSMPTSATPYRVIDDCACAKAGSAAATATARSDFFIDQSPRFLDSTGARA